MTPLSTPPTRSDSVTFAARGDALMTALPAFVTEANALQADVSAKQALAAASASAAQADRVLTQAGAAAVAAASPAANAAAAQAAAAAAAISAGLAQATNPDSPIRINPRRITADFTVGSNYNAASVGPITISDGTTVTVSDNATWSIH
jgi:hypothetical protein